MQSLLDYFTTDNPALVGRQHFATPGVAVTFSTPDKPTQTITSGYAALLPSPSPITPTTIFDLASVTKLFTATLAAISVEQNRVSWDTPLASFIPLPDYINSTFLDLVNHTAGFQAWEKFYLTHSLYPTDEEVDARKKNLLQESAKYIRPPEEIAKNPHTYSDIGYLILGFILEQLHSDNLATLIDYFICQPLNLHDTFFPAATTNLDQRRFASTEWCAIRHQYMTGWVHDENCDVFGAVTGHAGLFSTSQDLYSFGLNFVKTYHGEQTTTIVKPETLHYLWQPKSKVTHRGGWDIPTGVRSSVGRGLTNKFTFGHLGFTGTSLWLNTKSNVVIACLTNRVHPTRQNPLIKELRIALHEAIVSPTEE